MARKITIPITDHEAHCNTGYTVSYKLDGETYWNSQPWSIPPIEITGLLDNSTYNISIVRNCCDGIQSAPLELTVSTALLSTPENFIATPGYMQIELDWDPVAGATHYRVERAADAAFLTPITIVYTSSGTAIVDDVLPDMGTFYYRVKGVSYELGDGPYAYASATPLT